MVWVLLYSIQCLHREQLSPRLETPSTRSSFSDEEELAFSDDLHYATWNDMAQSEHSDRLLRTPHSDNHADCREDARVYDKSAVVACNSLGYRQ